ncbi:hypothetical protein LEMLEM_LOCUS23712 [Lemmus lemmus]
MLSAALTFLPLLPTNLKTLWWFPWRGSRFLVAQFSDEVKAGQGLRQLESHSSRCLHDTE